MMKSTFTAYVCALAMLGAGCSTVPSAPPLRSMSPDQIRRVDQTLYDLMRLGQLICLNGLDAKKRRNPNKFCPQVSAKSGSRASKEVREMGFLLATYASPECDDGDIQNTIECIKDSRVP